MARFFCAMADDGPLAGHRVIEWASGLATSCGGFLLRELGAEVVRVEPPGARSPGDHVLHRGKRSVTLDLARADDATAWAAMLAGADATLSDEGGPAVPPDAALVRCRVAAWGGGGPRCSLPPEEGLVAAATGVHATQWSWSRRPVWLATPMIGYMTAILAALGVTSALFARRRGAPGQAVGVTGLGGAFALNTGTYVTGPAHRGSLLDNGDPRGVYPNYGFYPTADGWLFVGALTQAFWVKLATLLERVDLLADPRLPENPLAFGSPAVRSFLRGELGPLFAARTTAEWMVALQAADVPCGAVQSREDFLRDPDARALGYAVPVVDPVLGATWQPAGPAAFSDTPVPPPRAAEPPGTSTAAVRAETRHWHRVAAGPGDRPPRACLEGIRVLDLTSFIAGPVCPMLLADLGADVVKIESADGDPFRNAAFAFVGWNRGKRSLVLDLKRPEGRAVFLDLARTADLVVDNLRAGVMDRLGIGWDTLRDLNARLIHLSITGYGTDTPLSALPGFDPIFQARSGLSRTQGGDDEPVFHIIAYNDYCGGALGALAAVAALVARERTGRGQRVDVSLFRTAFVDQAAEMILYPGRPAWPRGGRDYLGPAACRRLYACRDGWLSIVATTAEAAGALGRLAGVTIGLDDPADGAAASAVERLLADEARARGLERLAAAGVPAAPCLTFDELWTDEHLRANGCFAETHDPELGRVVQGGPLLHFEATPIGPARTAPQLGADGPQVLRELGYDEERIAALREARIVGP